MTSEEMIEEYLNTFGQSKSNHATAKVALTFLLNRQREMCAVEVEKAAIAIRRLVVADVNYIKESCLNATGEKK